MERAIAWLATGPVGHLYGTVADIAELAARLSVKRAHQRVSAWRRAASKAGSATQGSNTPGEPTRTEVGSPGVSP